MRWYVEPLAYDQRSFNAAALRLIDDLEERVAELEAELKSRAMRIAVCAPQVPFVRGGAEIFSDKLVKSCATAATRPRSSPSPSSGIPARGC